MKLFFAVADKFPPWRFDVDELFAKQLASKGMEITWSTRRNSAGFFATEFFRNRPVWLPLKLPGNNTVMKIINAFVQGSSDFVVFARLLFGSRFDCIQIRDRRYLMAFLGWIAARARGSKYIYWLSYPFAEHMLEEANSRIGLSKLLYIIRGSLTDFFVYHFLVFRADHVFVQSQQMRDQLAGYGVPEKRITPVPMGVPPTLLQWKNSNPDCHPIRGRVVYVGTLIPMRQLQLVIEAFAITLKRVPHAHLVMVGDGDKIEDRRSLERLADSIGISESVTFTGFVPVDEVWRWVAGADICISPIRPTPAHNTASPGKLVEYMALGKPVVVNDHPEQSAILREAGVGVCVKWSADSFAEGMVLLLTDSEGARRMGERGPAWVAANRTYDKIALLVLSKYREMSAVSSSASR